MLRAASTGPKVCGKYAPGLVLLSVQGIPQVSRSSRVSRSSVACVAFFGCGIPRAISSCVIRRA